jgi:hypothetical protein
MKKHKELLKKFLESDYKKLYKKFIKQKMHKSNEYNENSLSSNQYDRGFYKGELKLNNTKNKKYLKSGQTWVEINNKVYFCNGFGIWTNPKNQFGDAEIYAGEWRNGLRSGKGVEWDIAGNKYTGYWKNGIKFGYGKQIYSDGGIQEGIFDDTLDIGTEMNLDGNEDYFLLKKIETFSYQSKKNKPRIYLGKLHYKDGSIYEGEFTSPNPGANGKGKLKKANGEIIKGTWKNGNFVK